MLKISNTQICGWEPAIRGMRNPMNSWGKSDSGWISKMNEDDVLEHFFEVGRNDITLMKKLAEAGSDHRIFMRMIEVYIDAIAPLYWWKEADRYRIGTVINSCSTMHKIHDKEFVLDDFSYEHLTPAAESMLHWVIKILNELRQDYLNSKDKAYWYSMIQLLPSSYNQRRTWMLNYEVLRNIYHARKNHKLDEWREFCNWIETLPYSELITGGEE